MSEITWSQVQAINEPTPKSWDDYERGCKLTYRGGHHDEPELGAFQHGMGTVFNLLRGEFPSAQLCKAAPDLRDELKQSKHDMACALLCLLQNDPEGARDILKRHGDIVFPDGGPTFPSAAIAKATSPTG